MALKGGFMRLYVKVSTFILRPILRFLDFLMPFADLIARIWIAQIFFLAGLNKIRDWETTLMLFTNEYRVPCLTPTLAAYIGTGFELVLPILLILGLGGRLMILLFFVYNLMCVVSYHHFLLTPNGYEGLMDHITWGVLLLLMMVHGPGKYSLDYFIAKKWGHHIK